MRSSKRFQGSQRATLYVGCAGWSIRREHAELFPAEGSHLERYAGRFPAVEINSSFYRPHRPATYERWAASVPTDFRFAVKMPRSITHQQKLEGIEELLERFLAEAGALGEKLGPILVQLPPRLALDEGSAGRFFTALRERFAGLVACEPRHASWFTDGAARLLHRFRIARVAADPAVVPAAAEPGGWDGLIYYRWHGSPRIYYSEYSAGCIEALAAKLGAPPHVPRWCIFDNTAVGAATTNALELLQRVYLPAARITSRDR